MSLVCIMLYGGLQVLRYIEHGAAYLLDTEPWEVKGLFEIIGKVQGADAKRKG